MSKKSGIGKFLVGLGVGAGLGMLFAPKSGSETRKDLKVKYDEFIKSLKDIDVNEVKDEFLDKIEDINVKDMGGYIEMQEERTRFKEKNRRISRISKTKGNSNC